MADYTYRIFAAAGNTAPNFTTLNAAVADFKAADRTGSGTNGRVAASSTVFFKIDGFLTLAAAQISGIDTTTNSNAAIVLDSYSNAWNATARALGYTTSLDGILLGSGGSVNLDLGDSAARQAHLTCRNLVLSASVASGGAVRAWGLGDGSSNVLLDRCFIRNNDPSAAKGIELDAGDMRNCVLYLPNATTTNVIFSTGRTGGNKIDQSTIIALGGANFLVENNNDPNPIFRNCYIGGVFGNGYTSGGSFTSASTGNAVSTATTWTGPTGTINSVALSTANFLNVTNGSEDFRVQSGSVLKTTGATRLASPGDVDVFGTARGTPATIGAFEVAAAAGHFFRSNPGGNLSGLGSSGPFFQNPLQRVADVWKRRNGIFVPINYFNREALA